MPKDLEEFGKLMLGFLPWILFLFLAGHTLVSLERALIICLTVSVVCGFKDLRKGFIISWGTLIFFVVSAFALIVWKSRFVATHMGVISNAFLASLIWGSIIAGKPFTLQYARESLPPERWTDPAVLGACRIIAVVWASLMTFSAVVASFKALAPGLLPSRAYAYISIGTMCAGMTFTTVYKWHKRNQQRGAGR